MSDTRRIWQCRSCKESAQWQAGWNWRLPKPPETLESFHAFCSQECATKKIKAEKAA